MRTLLVLLVVAAAGCVATPIPIPLVEAGARRDVRENLDFGGTPPTSDAPSRDYKSVGLSDGPSGGGDGSKDGLGDGRTDGIVGGDALHDGKPEGVPKGDKGEAGAKDLTKGEQ